MRGTPPSGNLPTVSGSWEQRDVEVYAENASKPCTDESRPLLQAMHVVTCPPVNSAKDN